MTNDPPRAPPRPSPTELADRYIKEYGEPANSIEQAMYQRAIEFAGAAPVAAPPAEPAMDGTCERCGGTGYYVAPRDAAPPAEERLREIDEQLSRVLHEMAGSVSLCWKPKPNGEFESTLACEFVAAAIEELRAIIRGDAAPAAEPVAQPPEAPPARLRQSAQEAREEHERGRTGTGDVTAASLCGRLARELEGAASRIESDAERIRASEERAKVLFDAKNHWADRARAAEADAGRWRMLMHLGTCYYDTSPKRPAPICEGSKRVYFHECDQEGDVTLTEYIDAAIAEEGRKP